MTNNKYYIWVKSKVYIVCSKIQNNKIKIYHDHQIHLINKQNAAKFSKA